MYDSNLKDESVDQNEANKVQDGSTKAKIPGDNSRRKSIGTGTQFTGTSKLI